MVYGNQYSKMTSEDFGRMLGREADVPDDQLPTGTAIGFPTMEAMPAPQGASSKDTLGSLSDIGSLIGMFNGSTSEQGQTGTPSQGESGDDSGIGSLLPLVMMLL